MKEIQLVPDDISNTCKDGSTVPLQMVVFVGASRRTQPRTLQASIETKVFFSHEYFREKLIFLTLFAVSV